MCGFTEPVKAVEKTFIAVCPLANPKQYSLVYANRVHSERPNVMILPIHGRFLQMRSADPLPKDLASQVSKAFQGAFKPVPVPTFGSFGSFGPPDRDVAPTFAYGSYTCSVAADLNRIDWKAFGTHPTTVEAFRKEYTKTDTPKNFLVCKLSANKTTEEQHPIVYDFELAAGATKVVLPTVHIHNGVAEPVARDWDHVIMALGRRVAGSSPVFTNVTYDRVQDAAGPFGHQHEPLAWDANRVYPFVPGCGGWDYFQCVQALGFQLQWIPGSTKQTADFGFAEVLHIKDVHKNVDIEVSYTHPLIDTKNPATEVGAAVRAMSMINISPRSEVLRAQAATEERLMMKLNEMMKLGTGAFEAEKEPRVFVAEENKVSVQSAWVSPRVAPAPFAAASAAPAAAEPPRGLGITLPFGIPRFHDGVYSNEITGHLFLATIFDHRAMQSVDGMLAATDRLRDMLVRTVAAVARK